MNPTRERAGLIITIVSAMIFGLYPAAARVAYANGANSTFVIVTTTFCRALALVVLCGIQRRRVIPNRAALGPTITGGFFQALSIFGIIGSLAYLPGPITITILFTHTIMLLIFMVARGEAVLTPAALTTTLSALLGVALVVDVFNHFAETNVLGVVLAFVASLATMSRLYVFGKQVQHDAPAVVGARIFSTAFLFTLVLLAVDPPRLPLNATGYYGTVGAALSLSIATIGMFYGIQILGPFKYSLMVKAEPAFTAIFSFLIAGEVLKLPQYLGIALVLGSLVAYQVFTKPSSTSGASGDLTDA